MNNKIIVGITHGDINGIGYELIIKTFSDERLLELCTPVIYGSSKVLAYHRKVLNASNFNVNSINSAKDVHIGRINLVNCVDDDIKVELGKQTEMAGNASFTALSKATEELKQKFIHVLVTCPINKFNIQSDDFKFPGHTEYLQQEFEANDSLMLMISEVMRVGVVTGHIPINEVSKNITSEKIERKLQILHQTLLKDFNIRKPRIAVLGLNPHAGDDGLIGTEDKDILLPVIEKLRSKDQVVLGPFAADGFFGSGEFSKFDGILAMYHDQGLIPFKAIAMESGVNYTAGLEIVRTSPAHGTAFNIAGEGKANIQSFREAIYAAIDIHKNRILYKQVNKNPLKKQHVYDPYKAKDVSVQDLEKEVKSPRDDK